MTLCIPKKVLDQHLVVLGKTGAGKSSALRHMVEYLLAHDKRVVVIDPKGDWWGLKASADGKAAGYQVIAFGTFKEEKASDVPISRHSGQHVAELVASGNRPCVIGFRGWMPMEMTQFWVDFATHLFAKNAGELYLVIDEVHNFAPKGRTEDPMVAKSLNRTNRLMAEGRGVGVVVLCASQRPQKVHNDTLTSCETLVAMRVIHAADRKALKEWIDGCGDSDRGKDLLENVANLARGEGYVWSPEIGFGPERVKFPMFETFDSFAPPQLQRKVSTSGWADVDLVAVKEKLATVIEEAKANDPEELKKTIRQLKAELGKVATVVPAAKTEVKYVDKPVLSEADRALLMDAKRMIREGETAVERAIYEIEKRVKQFSLPVHVTHVPIARSDPAPVQRAVRATAPTDHSNGSLNGAQRKMLSVLANRQGKATARNQLAIFAGYSAKSSHLDNTISSLRTSGYIAGSGSGMQITTEGLAALGHFDPLPSGEELIRYWVAELGKGPGSMLRVMADRYPEPISREELAAAVGFSATSSHLDNCISRLRTMELAIGPGASLVASRDLFE